MVGRSEHIAAGLTGLPSQVPSPKEQEDAEFNDLSLISFSSRLRA